MAKSGVTLRGQRRQCIEAQVEARMLVTLLFVHITMHSYVNLIYAIQK